MDSLPPFVRHLAGNPDQYPSKRPRVGAAEIGEAERPKTVQAGHLSASSADAVNGRQAFDVRIRVEAASCYRPKADLGEDAHFINRQGRGFGVADGVGSWARRGVDAGVFSRELLSLCNRSMEILPFTNGSGVTFLQCILASALQATTAPGTCTVCIGEVGKNSVVGITIGDSRVVLVRDGVVVSGTHPQQQSFNNPLQIGGVTPANHLSQSKHFKWGLVPGDVIVAATDGLFDNMFEEQIAALVTSLLRERRPSTTAEEMAEALAAGAIAAASDPNSRTPFAEASTRAGLPRTGGKIDDITVVVIKCEADRTAPKKPAELCSRSRGLSQSMNDDRRPIEDRRPIKPPRKQDQSAD